MSFPKTWMFRPGLLANHPTMISVINWIVAVYIILIIISFIGFCLLIYWFSDMLVDYKVNTDSSTGKRRRLSFRRQRKQMSLLELLETSEENSLPEVPSSFMRALLPKVHTVNEKPGIGACIVGKRVPPE